MRASDYFVSLLPLGTLAPEIIFHIFSNLHFAHTSPALFTLNFKFSMFAIIKNLNQFFCVCSIFGRHHYSHRIRNSLLLLLLLSCKNQEKKNTLTSRKLMFVCSKESEFLNVNWKIYVWIIIIKIHIELVEVGTNFVLYLCIGEHNWR